MAIRKLVFDAGVSLKRTAKRLGNWFRAENEKPMAAFRDWLKIIISLVAIGALVVTTRQLGIQTNALVTQGNQLKTQTDQLQVQADQLKVQAKQMMIQSQQAEQATRATNIALAVRLSSQLTDIENASIKLSLLRDSFDDMMRLTTAGLIKDKALDQHEIKRSADLINRVRKDRDALEASTHALPIQAFQVVRKYYVTAAIMVEQFARDLDAIQTDPRLQDILAPDQEVLQMRKNAGLPMPKLFPRFADARSSVQVESFKDYFAAATALINASKATEQQWTEVEKAINGSPP